MLHACYTHAIRMLYACYTVRTRHRPARLHRCCPFRSYPLTSSRWSRRHATVLIARMRAPPSRAISCAALPLANRQSRFALGGNPPSRAVSAALPLLANRQSRFVLAELPSSQTSPTTTPSGPTTTPSSPPTSRRTRTSPRIRTNSRQNCATLAGASRRRRPPQPLCPTSRSAGACHSTRQGLGKSTGRLPHHRRCRMRKGCGEGTV